MQVTLLFGCLVLVISVEVQRCDSAFRAGSALRHKWGFKRSSRNFDWLYDLQQSADEGPSRQQVRIPVQDIVGRIQNDPEVAFYVVDAFMDLNGDGFVTDEEFLG